MPKPKPKSQAPIPDAWDDDWEAQADEEAQQESAPSAPPSPQSLTKKDLLARHARENKRLWDAADTHHTPPPAYLSALSPAPPKLPSPSNPSTTTLAPTVLSRVAAATATNPIPKNQPQAVKLLSRTPIPSLAPATEASLLRRPDATTHDTADPLKRQEELRRKQLREREEKQRIYDEARAKIFGDAASSSSSQPATASSSSQPGSAVEGRKPIRRGRGGGQSQSQREGGGPPGGGVWVGTGGGGGAGKQKHGNNYGNPPDNGMKDVTKAQGPTPEPYRSPARRELYDPNAPAGGKPGRKEGSERAEWPWGRGDEPVRQPRGPPEGGRGGFGFRDQGQWEGKGK